MSNIYTFSMCYKFFNVLVYLSITNYSFLMSYKWRKCKITFKIRDTCDIRLVWEDMESKEMVMCRNKSSPYFFIDRLHLISLLLMLLNHATCWCPCKSFDLQATYEPQKITIKMDMFIKKQLGKLIYVYSVLYIKDIIIILGSSLIYICLPLQVALAEDHIEASTEHVMSYVFGE